MFLFTVANACPALSRSRLRVQLTNWSRVVDSKQNFACAKENIYEPPHDKTNKMACAPSEDSDQPGHPPSLIRVFVVHSMGS